MYDWLRVEAESYKCWLDRPDRDYLWEQVDHFINWLERTGATPWRSVEDGLPEEGQEIFALHCDPMAALFNGFHAEARTYCAVDNLKWMAYWMPVPPLPKEEP